MDTETSLLCKYHDLPHEIVADAVGEAKVKYYLYANQALRCRIMEARKWIFTVAEHELHDAIAYESRFRHFDVSDRFSFYASADIICEKTRIRAYSFITQQYSTPSFEDSLLNTMALNAALGDLRKAKPEWAEVTSLRAFHGYTFPEIAKRVGCTSNAAKIRFARACKYLKKCLM